MLVIYSVLEGYGLPFHVVILKPMTATQAQNVFESNECPEIRRSAMGSDYGVNEASSQHALPGELRLVSADDCIGRKW